MSTPFQTVKNTCATSTTHTHTLRIGCTELKAVLHAGLGFQFLRVQVMKPEKEVEVHQVQRGHKV